MAYISLGLQSGAKPYQSISITDVNIELSPTSTYGKKFIVDGESIDASVGAVSTYERVAKLNDNTITIVFDYDINNVRLYAKARQSTGETSQVQKATISSDKRTVTINYNLNPSLTDAYLLVFINGDVEPEISIDNQVENTTYSVEETRLTLITDDGYIFDGSPKYKNGAITRSMKRTSDIEYYCEVDTVDETLLTGVTKKVRIVKITGELINCSCNYSDGEVVDTNKRIEIKANKGYKFDGVYDFKIDNITKTMSKSDDGTLLYRDIKDFDIGNYELFDTYKATKEVEQVGTFVNLYKVTQSELTELSKKRIVISDGTVTDYGQFINSLYILPFNLPSDMLGDRTSIILGNLDSNVDSTLITTYMFNFAGGEIEVPLKYNNIYDFVNTECILHLPFLDKIYLNTEYVIGQKLTLHFTVDLYSGSLTINVTSSFNDEIIASVKGLIGMNIPFIQKSNNSVINSVSNVYKNNINRCFIEVNRNIPYTKNSSVFGGAVVEYGRIGDYTGYLECDSIVLETNATNQEQEEIKSLLRNGVFI